MESLVNGYAYFFIPLIAFLVDAFLSFTPARAYLDRCWPHYIHFWAGIFFSPSDRHGQQLRYGVLFVIATLLGISLLSGLLLIFIGWTYAWAMYALEVFYLLLCLGLTRDVLAIKNIKGLLENHRVEEAQDLLESHFQVYKNSYVESQDLVRLASQAIEKRVSFTLVGPLLVFALADPLAALLYTAIYHMVLYYPVGQKSYRYFGQFADRLWFILSYIPNRLTSALWACARWIWREPLTLKAADKVQVAYLGRVNAYAYTVALLMILLASFLSFLLMSW